MKKINKKIPKKVSTVDNKRLAAYALLAFFVFVFIGSVLGILAFFRTNKEESAFNVVSANADIVTDFSNQVSINEVYFVNDTFETNSSSLEIYDWLGFGQDVVGINITDYNAVNSNGYMTLCPVDFFYSDYKENEFFIAFELYGYGLNHIDYLPNFCLETVNEYMPNQFERVQYYFTRDIFSSYTIYSLVYRFDEESGDVETFFQIKPYDDGLSEEGYDYNLFNFQVHRNSYSYFAPSYTYNEFREMYDTALNERYQAGLNSNTAYQEGFDEGYLNAIDTVSNTMEGILQYSQCTIQVESFSYGGVITEGFTDPNVYVYPGSVFNSVDFYATLKASFEKMNYDGIPDVYDLNDVDFIFTVPSYKSIIPSLLTLRLTTTDIFEEGDLPLTVKITDTFNNDYYAEYDFITSQEAVLKFDFSSMPDLAKVVSIKVRGFVRGIVQGGFVMYDSGPDYSLGYEVGYNQGYDMVLQNFDTILAEEYQKGVKYGQQVYYQDGYNAGVQAANDYTFTSLLSSVIDVPIRAFTSLFNFDLLGINLANFFFALLTMCIVLAVIKLII